MNRESGPFYQGRFWIFRPEDFLPDLSGTYGITLKRIFASTSLVAITFGLMRAIPSVAAAAIVLPLWCAAAGCLIDGYRGAARGFIMAIVYPVYLAVIVAIAILIFWCYALIHRGVAGDSVLW
ncbi:MAG: hypothetical protein AAGG44_07795 [Planctomycetota bacterium]